MRTAKNIIRHELIGLKCEIINSENISQKGISGKIVDETMKTIVIETGKSEKKIPKKGTMFRLEIGKQSVDINGDYLVARPEDRIKKKFTRW